MTKKNNVKHKDGDLERIPLLFVYKQGGNIYADQPEENINHFEFYAFLKIYVESYGDRLKRDYFSDEGELVQ